MWRCCCVSWTLRRTDFSATTALSSSQQLFHHLVYVRSGGLRPAAVETFVCGFGPCCSFSYRGHREVLRVDGPLGRTSTLTRGFLKRRKYSCGAYVSSVAMTNRRASRNGFSSRVNGQGFLPQRVMNFPLPCARSPRSDGQCRPGRELLRSALAGSLCRYASHCAP